MTITAMTTRGKSIRSGALGATVAVLLAGAGLAACATATPYQPNVPGQAVSGGFSDQRLDATHFRVTFAGNSLTSRETVERYLLYRAAELTADQGYDWFATVEKQVDRSSRTYVTPDPFSYGPSRFGYWRPYWRYYGAGPGWRRWDPWYGDQFWADQMDVRTVEKFEATAEIVMGKGPPPAADQHAFDARDVLTNLGPTIVRPG